MPRKSAEEQAIKPVLTFAKAPPPPPEGMSERAETEWRTITERLPADWFDAECFAILRGHCEAVAECEALQEMIEIVRPKATEHDDWNDRYRRLLRAKDQTARLVLASATKLRLTPQSRILPRKAGGAAERDPSSPRPWDFAG